jgi:hypothetical protein
MPFWMETLIQNLLLVLFIPASPCISHVRVYINRILAEYCKCTRTYELFDITESSTELY